MAAITSAIVGGIGALGSAYSSYRGARAQDNAQRQAQQRLEEGLFGPVNVSGGGGSGGTYNPVTGQISTRLGGRLQGQLSQVDAFANMFAGQAGTNPLASAFGTIGNQQQVAYNQAPTNLGLFDNLQNQAQGGLGLAGLNMLGAGQDALNLSGLGNQAFGTASNYLGELGGGGSEAARAQTLDLLRQQAQPFEERAFSSLQNNLFSTGRLGSSGGALQTEAFARGLGQADLSRQLAANQEGRNFQQNALGLAQGSFGIGEGQRGLSQNLLNSAFSNFGNLAGLSADIEQSRYGQASAAQTNFFNQLGSLAQNQTALAQGQQGMQSNDFMNFLTALTAGQGISQIPFDQLGFALDAETARSNAALGSGTAQLGVQRGQGSDALAAALGGLGQAASGWLGGFSGGTGNSYAPAAVGGRYSPSTLGGSGAVISSSAFGPNPFANLLPINPGGGY